MNSLPPAIIHRVFGKHLILYGEGAGVGAIPALRVIAKNIQFRYCF